MDRAQFMKQLERLLSDISEAEKQEALAYYNSYFDEAGPENEAKAMRNMHSIQRMDMRTCGKTRLLICRRFAKEMGNMQEKQIVSTGDIARKRREATADLS